MKSNQIVKILGISGFENSVPFKKAHWPGLNELGDRTSEGHDSAAALRVEGQWVASVTAERINRKKHIGDFPAGAIRYCLDEVGLSKQDGAQPRLASLSRRLSDHPHRSKTLRGSLLTRGTPESAPQSFP